MVKIIIPNKNGPAISFMIKRSNILKPGIKDKKFDRKTFLHLFLILNSILRNYDYNIPISWSTGYCCTEQSKRITERGQLKSVKK